MDKIFMFILIFALWISTMLLFKKVKMNFFRFMTGSIGVFFICVAFFMPFFESSLSGLIANTLYLLSKATGYFQVYKQYSILTFNAKGGIVSLLIDYECSGVIEMLVFTSLAAFFPFGRISSRIWTVLWGNTSIFLANIIRVLFIVLVTKSFGVSYFYIAHTLLGRVLFFVFMIVIYYFAFTTIHLKNQKVGDIR